jgi:hypothetical protein
MSLERREPSDSHFLDELSPALRNAVGSVLRDPMPHDLARGALEQVQRRLAIGEGHHAGSIAGHRRSRRRVMFWALLATSISIGLIALAVLARFAGTKAPEVVIAPRQQIVIPAAPTVPDDNVPTAWAYHEALRQSPEAVDALLDRHARHSLSGDPWSFPARASPRWSPDLL